jgi:hypothetical protein
MAILDGECMRVEMFERPSADAISIEKMASQKSASEAWMSVCPQAKAHLPQMRTGRVSFVGFVGHVAFKRD